VAIITGTTWLVLTVLLRFILPQSVQFVLSVVIAVMFVILPIANHVGIFVAIRRHNNQVQDAVSGQNLSVIFRREKKAAIDMIIVISVLLLCLAPAVVVNVVAAGDTFKVLYVWSVTIMFVNSSINPVIYLARNSDIRNAVRSMMCF